MEFVGRAYHRKDCFTRNVSEVNCLKKKLHLCEVRRLGDRSVHLNGFGGAGCGRREVYARDERGQCLGKGMIRSAWRTAGDRKLRGELRGRPVRRECSVCRWGDALEGSRIAVRREGPRRFVGEADAINSLAVLIEEIDRFAGVFEGLLKLPDRRDVIVVGKALRIFANHHETTRGYRSVWRKLGLYAVVEFPAGEIDRSRAGIVQLDPLELRDSVGRVIEDFVKDDRAVARSVCQERRRAQAETVSFLHDVGSQRFARKCAGR